jgi:DNA replication and repair protein RecF
MHVSKLTLHDFRSYTDVEIDLEPGATAFIGSNGQGKTNLVEAVDYLSRLDSHRVSNDAPLVRAGAEQAIVRADVVRGDRTALLELEITPGRANRARINRGALPRTRDLIGVLASHPRRGDVRARLVEIDPRNVAFAEAGARQAGLPYYTA